MNENTREAAITGISGRRRGGSNIIIWILVFLVICGCNGSNFGNFGIGNFLGGDNCGCERRHHHHHHHHDKNNFSNLFGGNGFFIIIIIAILVLVADGNNNTNIINVDRDTEEGIDD